MRVLLTGGLGYIGSHTAIELIESGHRPLIVDNLENSTIEVLDSIARFAGARPEFALVDIRDAAALSRFIAHSRPDAIIHFAARKDPQESIDEPIGYYDVNVSGTVNLVKCACDHSVPRLVFSSSAAVYGHAQHVPISETHPLDPLSPYARTKHVAELLIDDVFRRLAGASAFILRYFNPVGTHRSGALVRHHNRSAKNLFPALMRAVLYKKEILTIHGEDLPTADGTGIRDFIHVQDLAAAHVAALGRLTVRAGVQILNVGTGRGYSVREVLETFERRLSRTVPYRFGPPRDGDPAVSYADTRRSADALGWIPKFSLEDMIEDEWSAFCAFESSRADGADGADGASSRQSGLDC